jgi:hypothetical protein
MIGERSGVTKLPWFPSHVGGDWQNWTLSPRPLGRFNREKGIDDTGGTADREADAMETLLPFVDDATREKRRASRQKKKAFLTRPTPRGRMASIMTGNAMNTPTPFFCLGCGNCTPTLTRDAHARTIARLQSTRTIPRFQPATSLACIAASLACMAAVSVGPSPPPGESRHRQGRNGHRRQRLQ